MITRDLDAFLAFARTATTDFGPATARAAFLIASIQPRGTPWPTESVNVRIDESRRALCTADAFGSDVRLTSAGLSCSESSPTRSARNGSGLKRLIHATMGQPVASVPR